MIKKGDFLKVDFTGIVKETGEVFDTTIAKTAIEHRLGGRNVRFEPMTVCVGQGFLFPKLEEKLVSKEIGKCTVDIDAADAFGLKLPNRMKIVPTQTFRKNEVQPFPGLQVDIDGMIGTVRAVTGGRTIVDFNHPLAGKDVRYELDIKEIVTDPVLKTVAMVEHITKLPSSQFSVAFAEGKATITLPAAMPDELKGIFEKQLKETVPEAKGFSFAVSAEKKDAAALAAHEHAHDHAGHDHAGHDHSHTH